MKRRGNYLKKKNFKNNIIFLKTSIFYFFFNFNLFKSYYILSRIGRRGVNNGTKITINRYQLLTIKSIIFNLSLLALYLNYQLFIALFLFFNSK